MVGVGEVFDGPIHARGEVVLEGFAPAPDGGLVGDVLRAVDSGHGVLRGDAHEFVATLGPDGMGLAVGLAIDVAAAPSAPVGPAPGVEAIVDEAEVGRRVAFHDEQEARIKFAERAFAADVGLEPLVGDGGEVGAGSIAVVGVAADASPGGVVVLAAVG